MRIVIDCSEIDRALRSLPDIVVRPAARMALNDAGRQGNTAAKAAVREKFNLTAGFINQRIRIGSFASDLDLSLSIEATGRPIDLTHFGARWVRGNRVVSRAGVKMFKRSQGSGGVFYEAERGKPGHLPHAFIATVKAGKRGATHMGVFVRAGDDRMPIIKKMLISVPSMFEQPQVFEAVRKVVEEKFPERFQHHLDRTVEKFTGPS